MAEKRITCIICPIGCEITVCGEESRIDSIAGNTCKRGEAYARDEFIHPARILTSTVKVTGADVPLVAVRSSKPIPKELLLDCMEQIRKLEVKAPVKRYDPLIPNILGTGADIVATAGTD